GEALHVAAGGTPDAMATIGAGHSCAVVKNGSVRCWGANDAGQLGDGKAEAQNSTPVNVTVSGAVTMLALGRAHGCALPAGGKAPACWGANTEGELGNGTTTASDTPTAVTSAPADVAEIAAGSHNTC